ncbi:hypothetical protein PSFL111601_12150 [Pseudomonas floridensis]
MTHFQRYVILICMTRPDPEVPQLIDLAGYIERFGSIT